MNLQATQENKYKEINKVRENSINIKKCNIILY